MGWKGGPQQGKIGEPHPGQLGASTWCLKSWTHPPSSLQGQTVLSARATQKVMDMGFPIGQGALWGAEIGYVNLNLVH